MSMSPTPEMARYQRLIFSKDGPSPSCRLLLHVLVRFHFAGNDGRIFPSEETLAEDTGFSVRTIRRLIPELERDGWIRRQTFGIKGQQWRRNEYKLTWPNGFDPKTDQWLQEVKAMKDVGRRAYREAARWTPEEAVILEGIDPQAWEAWLAFRASIGAAPTMAGKRQMAGMLRDYSAEGQRSIVEWSNSHGWKRPANLEDWRRAWLKTQNY